MKILNKKFIGSFGIILLCGVILTVSAQTDKKIAEIQNIYNETNEKVFECEENGEYSSVFLSELVVNKNNGSYPAVGIYKTVFKFYYTFGDREKNPYPYRLLKITISTNRSARKEYSEYLFNSSGQLIFYFEKNDDEAERRFYFASEKLIKSLSGEKMVNINGRKELEAVKIFLNEKKKLVGIFGNSLRY